MVCDNNDLEDTDSKQIAELEAELEAESLIVEFNKLLLEQSNIECEIIEAFSEQYFSNTSEIPRLINVDGLSTFQHVYNDIDDLQLDNDERVRVIIQRIHDKLEDKPDNEHILDMIQQYHHIIDDIVEFKQSIPPGFENYLEELENEQV
jgi:hypothetical protein